MPEGLVPDPTWQAKARARSVPGACRSVPERAGRMPERAGHVKLQTKGGNVVLLCSDRHSSPGELRMAKRQT